MLFGRKKDKNRPNDRVLELKARVDALRAADDATRKEPYSLDHFLEGDDVLTGRQSEDEYTPKGFDPMENYQQVETKAETAPPEESSEGASPEPHADSDNHFEANLQAELEKYLKRQEALEQAAAPPVPEPPSHQPSEPTSLLLDGTWSRDADSRPSMNPAPMDPAGGWPAKAEDWSSLSSFPGETGEASDEAEEQPFRPKGFDERQWPADEEWPPREKAV